MVKLPKEIKDLFYNPSTDSINSLVQDLENAHAQILKKTDLAKGTLAPSREDYETSIQEFHIPTAGYPKKSFAPLIAALFNGVPRWHSPRTMYNVAPPPVLPSVISKALTSLYNPNLVLASASGESTVTEQKVIKSIAEYIGWDRESASGIFTFGGKATSIYGIKLGLKKCSPSSSAHGVKEDVIVLSTTGGHPSHISDAEWLGIGTANTFRLRTDTEGRVDLDDMAQTIEDKTKEGKKIAAIIISGGSTNNMTVDPIEKVIKLRDKLTQKLSLSYVPHVHVDAVVGFPWIFFKDYDFTRNPLGISSVAATRIKRVVEDLRGLWAADSFGIDFHKMGFSPYISSLFMVKDGYTFNGLKDVRHSPFVYSIENSRASDGPNSAYIALNALGERGYQFLIAHLTEMAIDLQAKLEKSDVFEVVNKTGLGSSVMFSPLLPRNIPKSSPTKDTALRNAYTSRFVEKLAELGNPYYLDKIPGNATGANSYSHASLKAYVMSPYSNKKTNADFVATMTILKHEIDKAFDFSAQVEEGTEFAHPLK